MSTFHTKSRDVKGATVISLSGMAEGTDAPKLSAILEGRIGKARGRIVIDLSQAEFLPSGIWGCLMAASRKCRERGGEMAAVGLSGNARRSYDSLGLSPYLRNYATVEEAISHLPATGAAPASQESDAGHLVADLNRTIGRRRKEIEELQASREAARSSLAEMGQRLEEEEKRLAAEEADLATARASVEAAESGGPVRPALSPVADLERDLKVVHLPLRIRWEGGAWSGYTSAMGPHAVCADGLVEGIPLHSPAEVDLDLASTEPVTGLRAWSVRDAGDPQSLLAFDPDDERVLLVRRFGREYLGWDS